jgi:hypothetical protein
MRGMARVRAKGLTAFTSVGLYCNGGGWKDLVGALEAQTGQ